MCYASAVPGSNRLEQQMDHFTNTVQDAEQYEARHAFDVDSDRPTRAEVAPGPVSDLPFDGAAFCPAPKVPFTCDDVPF